MSHKLFVESLEKYKANLPPEIQQEFLRPDNTLDTKYLSAILNDRVSETIFRKLVNNTLGQVVFSRTECVNEVTKELFVEHYQYAKYPLVRGWIGFFKRTTGKLLTREKLYEFITDL